MTRTLLLSLLLLLACGGTSAGHHSSALTSGTIRILADGQSNATTGAGNAAYGGPDLEHWNPTAGAWQEALTGHAGGSSTMRGTGFWLGRLARRMLDDARDVARKPRGRVINAGWPGKPIAYFLPISAEIGMTGAGPDPLERNHFTVVRDWWDDGGEQPDLIAISQGEADSGRSQAEYYADLVAWIDALHALWPHAKIVIYQTAIGACSGDSKGPRAAQAQLASERSYVLLVTLDDVTGVPPFHDGCHYGEPGYDLFADRTPT